MTAMILFSNMRTYVRLKPDTTYQRTYVRLKPDTTYQRAGVVSGFSRTFLAYLKFKSTRSMYLAMCTGHCRSEVMRPASAWSGPASPCTR